VAQALKTTVTELPESRVRVQVEVPAEEIEGRVERKATQLGRELKLPGFRRGKVPAQLVIQRVGREVVLEEAVRDSISSWYSEAIDGAGIVPVGDPELDIGELPPKGQPLEFSIEIGVLPKAQLGSYRGIEAPRREPAVEDAQIDAEIEAMRERLARLQTADRAAASGDFVVVDYTGSLLEEGADEESAEREGDGDGGDGARAEGERAARGTPIEGARGRDQLIELGGGRLIPGFEEALVGASAGQERSFRLRFPDDYGGGNPVVADELAGREASFEVAVKEVKQKELPELDEDFAIDAGFDDLEELREDIRAKLLEVDGETVEGEFREAALDAAVAAASVELTEQLVNARAHEMWERMLHALSHRGISREAYLQISGRSEREQVAELEQEAELALRREAVITAIVEAEGISPSDAEVLEALEPTAQREGVEPQEMLEQLRAGGRLEDVREDLAARKAIELIAAEAKPIAPARAQARERLWTPEKAAEQERAAAGAASAPARLWTPDR